MATNPVTGAGMYIDLITITDSSETNPACYQIKHGNYFPKNKEGKATWDQFYIDGKADGFPNGFQTLDEVEKFIKIEIKNKKELLAAYHALKELGKLKPGKVTPNVTIFYNEFGLTVGENNTKNGEYITGKSLRAEPPLDDCDEFKQIFNKE